MKSIGLYISFGNFIFFSYLCNTKEINMETKVPQQVIDFVNSGVLSKTLNSLHGNSGLDAYTMIVNKEFTPSGEAHKHMKAIMDLTDEKKLYYVDKGFSSLLRYFETNFNLGKPIGMECYMFDFGDFRIYTQPDIYGLKSRHSFKYPGNMFFMTVPRVTLPSWGKVKSEYKVFGI